MKQVTAACLVIVLIGSITSTSVWAHGGGGGGHGGGGGWGGHYGGGHYGGGWGYGRGGYYGGIGLGLGLGYGLGYYGGYPYYPYYAYPPVVSTVPVAPPVYIQQAAPQPVPQPQADYWHYCRNPEGYYPYVKECPGGWQQVAPTPPAPR
jgi:hypothetical protein